ncbi:MULTISPECIES: YigZ family protein [Aerococcus]|uniref:YigZ family protein n=1 Tax=Aerococcus sanguinicola TaxID=119206 RepID=A0A5N1GMT6_9LACT|nr:MULTISPECIES: YigZ family protein [Aerococcus]KAA9302287.1 YigZ family protein [Aerococcus sanguinicola]MDK6369041.1 YigZ family protein [Aerococcus sp. UMB9870]MDK6678943.1 YigZ family protein [Aerococcus sp. UMB8608]MDK6686534.1 YigZ family protein [Aerococcus sp. UMB8623]MDK6939602.1 YigZ family protein [Aerococcus sp. UMB8487]
MLAYRTIRQAGEHEIEIKKSRFICQAKRVFSEEEAQDFIQEINKKHWKATHNCVAFQIGEHNQIQRALDDGEPSGTAGVPMLEVLKQMDLKNIIVIVTRYFGGTKLGAGGLVRAYSHAVSEALQAIGIVERQVQQELAVRVDYPLTGPMEHWIENSPYQLLDTTYLADVCYHLGVAEDQVTACQEAITNLSSGQASFELGDKVYVDVPVEA